jgi:hypothetical protein
MAQFASVEASLGISTATVNRPCCPYLSLDSECEASPSALRKARNRCAQRQPQQAQCLQVSLHTS